jgi:hypothetical protein
VDDRRRHLSRILLFAAVAGAALLSALLPAAAAAATNDLGPIGFGTVVVDDARSQVLVSGPTANVVEVLDYSGNLVTTIPNVYGAWGMVVSGRYLYVAESTGGAIVRIDLTMPGLGATPIATGLFQPRWLALAGGKLWTTVTASGFNGYGQLTSVDLKTGMVRAFSQMYYSPDITASPGAPNTVFLAEDAQSPGAVYRIDVTTPKPRVRVSVRTDGSNIEDMAVSPDGTRVIPASGAPYYFEELSASTLQPDGINYPGQPYPAAVAVSPGRGGLLATGLTGGYSSPDIAVDPLGTPAPIFTASTYNSSGTANVRPHGLALTADGSMLFAVTSNDVYDTNTVFNTFALP